MSVPSPYQTVDDLVQNVINSTRLPINQITFTPTTIIQFMDDEQKTTITNLIKSIRENYWVTLFDQNIETNVYAYDMPPRCTAGALRDFVFVDTSGNEIQIAQLDIDQLKSPSYFAYRPSWQGQGAYLQDAKVMLWPTTYNNTSYQLRQKYERRPSTLTSVDNCVQIVTATVATNTIVLTESPPGWTAGQLVDVISDQPQFTSQGDNRLITSVVGSTITFDSDTPVTDTMAANMWVCPYGTTCIPQVPVEAYPLLMARGGLRIAAALQNSNLFSVFTKMVEAAEANVVQMMTPRVPGQPKKFINKNTSSGNLPYIYYR